MEVILDVVYTHTAEGNHLGPLLSFKGIDNTAYYRTKPDEPRYYMDYTGTGNTLNMRHPHVLQLIMDSLRYWILDMHVDGFRFDLAAALARSLHDVDRLSALSDLVSYNEKHNEANGEENRDAESHNRSWNSGAEGPTDDPAINALRAQQKRNFLATLLLSQGVPMIVAGDEMGRTQRGNNNAYCQDNEVSWLDWENLDRDLILFTQRLTGLRRTHPILRRRRWFVGRDIHGTQDLAWLKPAAAAMRDDHWANGFAKALAAFLNGAAVQTDTHGERVVDDSFYILFNAHHEPVEFTFPSGEPFPPPWAKPTAPA